MSTTTTTAVSPTARRPDAFAPAGGFLCAFAWSPVANTIYGSRWVWRQFLVGVLYCGLRILQAPQVFRPLVFPDHAASTRSTMNTLKYSQHTRSLQYTGSICAPFGLFHPQQFHSDNIHRYSPQYELEYIEYKRSGCKRWR